ncbi:MAG: biopolymer transporter ExbD [Pseudomonadota bacterium]
MKLSTPYPPKKPRIELIPLIDVMFFLLASFIFVSLSMVQHKGIRVDVPQAATGQPDRQEYYAVTITKDGKLYANKRLVTQAELVQELGKLSRQPDAPRVYINADKSVPHGEVIMVMDLAREAGIEKVALETKPRSPSAP